MKKIVVLVLSFMFFVVSAHAQTITDGEYTIEIENLYFEIYESDTFLAENEQGYLEYSKTPVVKEKIESPSISETFSDLTWNDLQIKKVRALNLNFDTSSYYEKFKSELPDTEKNYVGTIRAEYKISNYPSKYNYAYNFELIPTEMNLLLSLGKDTTYTIPKIEKTQTLNQYLWYSVYDSDIGDYNEYSSLSDADGVIYLFLNYVILSDSSDVNINNISEDDEVYFIHNLDDVSDIPNYLGVDPEITFYDITSDSIKLVFDYTNPLNTCSIYRKKSVDDEFELIDEVDCGMPYTDYGLEENTSYCYQIYVNETKRHSKTFTTRTLKKEIPTTTKRNITTTTTTRRRTTTSVIEDEKIYGSEDSPKTGIESYFLISLILAALSFLGFKYLKKYNKFIQK